MLRDMQLDAYFRQQRGRTKALAGKVGLSAAFLSQVANLSRPCPAERATAIERGTDECVRRWDLRPHDWHLIWPELIGTEGAPPVPQQQEVRDAA